MNPKPAAKGKDGENKCVDKLFHGIPFRLFMSRL
jgi:hypothetical protein